MAFNKQTLKEVAHILDVSSSLIFNVTNRGEDFVEFDVDLLDSVTFDQMKELSRLFDCLDIEAAFTSDDGGNNIIANFRFMEAGNVGK